MLGGGIHDFQRGIRRGGNKRENPGKLMGEDNGNRIGVECDGKL